MHMDFLLFGQERRSWHLMEFIWDQLLSDWLLFVCREGLWIRLDPFGWLLLYPSH